MGSARARQSRAGTTGNVTDVVQVVDSLANSANVSVSVGPGVTTTPRTASVAPNDLLGFAVSGGSGKGYAWSLVTNASGATIDASNGVYVAGRTGGVDVVRVVDSLGNGDSATVTVVLPPPPPSEPSGCDCHAAGSSSGQGFLAVLLATTLLGLRRFRRRPS